MLTAGVCECVLRMGLYIARAHMGMQGANIAPMWKDSTIFSESRNDIGNFVQIAKSELGEK